MAIYTNDKVALISITTSFSALVLAGLVGNTLVILVILTNSSMRSPMNFLLVNLAVADIMVATFVAPVFLVTPFISHSKGLTGELVCKFLTAGSFLWVGGAASVFSLVSISFERYFATVHPYSIKRRITMKKMKRLVVACWIFAVLLNVPGLALVTHTIEQKLCIIEWPKHLAWLAKAYSTLWFISIGVIPVTIMFYLYSRVIHTLWFRRSRHDAPCTQIAVKRSRKKATKIVVTVSVIYGLCWVSELTTFMMQSYGIQYTYGEAAGVGGIVVVTLNSAINPFVYTFQSKKFRSLLRKLMRCGAAKVGVPDQEISTTNILQRRQFTEHSV